MKDKFMDKPTNSLIKVYAINEVFQYMEETYDIDLNHYDIVDLNVRQHVMNIFYVARVEAIFAFAWKDIDVMRITMNVSSPKVCEELKYFIKFLELVFKEFGEPFFFEREKNVHVSAKY